MEGCTAAKTRQSTAVLGIKGISRFVEKAPCALPQTSMVVMNFSPPFGSRVVLKLTGDERLTIMLKSRMEQRVFICKRYSRWLILSIKIEEKA